jgi:hypothetical protein
MKCAIRGMRVAEGAGRSDMFAAVMLWRTCARLRQAGQCRDGNQLTW